MKPRSVVVSAPSKVILHGEHAVVYGKTAIAASLDLRTTIRLNVLSAQEEDVIRVDFPDVGVCQSWTLSEVRQLLKSRPTWPPDSRAESLASEATLFQTNTVDENFLLLIKQFVSDAGCDGVTLKSASLLCFFYLYALIVHDAIPIKISVESQIPIGAGLGSSAALSVCLAAGLFAIQDEDHIASKDLICKLAFVSEKILHGKPSGIDNSVSTFGGFVKFSDFKLTNIADAPQLRILLVNTKVTRNTKTLVEKVGKQCQDLPQVTLPIMDAIDGISQTCLSTMESMSTSTYSTDEKNSVETKKVFEKLGALIDYNQKLLEALQVSHPKIEEIIRIAASFGLHAKLTGAGGGGFAYILLPPTVKADVVEVITDLLTKDGNLCYETKLGVEGVRLTVAEDSASS